MGSRKHQKAFRGIFGIKKNEKIANIPDGTWYIMHRSAEISLEIFEMWNVLPIPAEIVWSKDLEADEVMEAFNGKAFYELDLSSEPFGLGGVSLMELRPIPKTRNQSFPAPRGFENYRFIVLYRAKFATLGRLKQVLG